MSSRRKEDGGFIGELGQPYPMSIGAELKRAVPDLYLGVIGATVIVEKENRVVWDMLQRLGREAVAKYRIDTLAGSQRLQDARDAYKRLGKDPSRYRISSEALLRRVLQGKGLYQVNSIVDINNVLSMESLLSVGSYDRDQLKGPVVFRVGRQEESYKGIGKETVNIAELPVFADEVGPFGSPTSDSERTMITLNTTNILMVLISFSGDLDGELQRYLRRGRMLLTNYARGANITTSVVT